MATDSEPAGLRLRLRAELMRAMKAHDPVVVAACRSALAVIDNAEAADVSAAPPVEEGTFAGGVSGLGAGEVARVALSDAEAIALLTAEMARWRAVASHHDSAAQPDRAARLRAEADVVAAILDSQPEVTDR